MSGVDPKVDISDVNGLVRVAEHCNQLPVHPRHPYAGELVFTAFSGSHQDAINKGFKAIETATSPVWEVPYLPIDPKDLGRSYEAVIRINSQSGKGGIAFILEKEHGIELPRLLQVEFSKVVQGIADGEGVELGADRLWAAFTGEYLDNGRFTYIAHRAISEGVGEDHSISARIWDQGVEKAISGHGNGPIDSFVDAMRKESGLDFDVANYREHAIGSGANAAAVSYVELRLGDGTTLFGVGIDKDIVVSSLKAVLSGVNRAIKRA
jgi:2-isopropylmalate synthase